MDGVQSCVTGTKIARGGGNFYYQYESVSWFLTGAMRSWSRHQNCKRMGVVQILVMSIKFTCRYSSTWCRKNNPGHGTKIARGWEWYRSDQHKFMSITCLSTGATNDNPGHGTKIARGNCRYKRYWLLLIGFIYEFLNLNCKRCPSTSLYEIRCV